MSDASQGPGWWQASDGKWYAPELHPDYQPPAAEVPTPPPAPEPTAPVPTPPAPEPTSAFPTTPPLEPTSPFGAAPPPGMPGGPPPGAPGGPPPVVPPAGGGKGGGAKWIAIIVVLLLIGGGAAYAITQSGSDGGSKDAFCSEAKSARDKLNSSLQSQADIDAFVATLDTLAKKAPSEIKADMQLLDDAFKKVANATRSAGSDAESRASAASSAAKELNSSQIKDAGDRVDAYAKKNCGFALSSDFTDASDVGSDSNSFSFDSDSFSSALSELSSFSDLSNFSDLSSLFSS